MGGYTHNQLQQLSPDQSRNGMTGKGIPGNGITGNGMTGNGMSGMPDGPSITLTTSNCVYTDPHKCTESTSVTLNVQESKIPELKKPACPCKIPAQISAQTGPTPPASNLQKGQVAVNKKYACQILAHVSAQLRPNPTQPDPTQKGRVAENKKPDFSQIPAQVLVQLRTNPTTRKCLVAEGLRFSSNQKIASGKNPARVLTRPEPYPTTCNLKKCDTIAEVQNTPKVKASILETQMDKKETEYPIINSETKEIVGTEIIYPFFKPCKWKSGSGFPYLTCTICDESFAKQFIFYHLKYFHPEI